MRIAKLSHNSYLPQCLIDDTGMLKMVVGEEVELIQEIPDIDAAKRIHLREGKHTRKATTLALSISQYGMSKRLT